MTSSFHIASIKPSLRLIWQVEYLFFQLICSEMHPSGLINLRFLYCKNKLVLRLQTALSLPYFYWILQRKKAWQWSTRHALGWVRFMSWNRSASLSSWLSLVTWVNLVWACSLFTGFYYILMVFTVFSCTAPFNRISLGFSRF